MQTLKSIHDEYLKKLAEEIVNKACISVWKCDIDDSTEKKKCLFRKSVNGNNTVLVDLWFDLIDAASEVIYTKAVDDMAYPDLIKEHFSQTKAKSFYEFLSNEFELVISDVYKKVCLRIPNVCRENPEFEKLVDYAEKELLEYFSFKKAFSYSRYMIENHSYIEDWFSVADMDTKEILELAEEEQGIIYMYISEANFMFAENLYELLEYTYSEMYEKTYERLKDAFMRDNDVDCEKKNTALTALVDNYRNIKMPKSQYYSYAWEYIGLILGERDNKRKQDRILRNTKRKGITQEDYYKSRYFTDDEKCTRIEKLKMSRVHIYRSQMCELNDKMVYEDAEGHSQARVNIEVRGTFYFLYGVDISGIYRQGPYMYNYSCENPPILWPRCVREPVVSILKLCMRECKEKITKKNPCNYCGNRKQLIETYANALFIIGTDSEIIKSARMKPDGKMRRINWQLIESIYGERACDEDDDVIGLLLQ